jgi:hypothetical protein
MNTLAQHDFQVAFKNLRSAGNGAYEQKGSTSSAMVTSESKVSYLAKWQQQSRKLWIAVIRIYDTGVDV